DVFGFPLAAAPLDFASALGTPSIGSFGPFLRPSTVSGGAPIAPIVDPATGHRYIGNSVTNEFVTGGTNGNSVTIIKPSGTVLDTTDQLIIIGEMTGSQVAPTANVFATQRAGVNSAPQTFTLSNFDTTAPVTLGTIAATGTNAADFTLTADT